MHSAFPAESHGVKPIEPFEDFPYDAIDARLGAGEAVEPSNKPTVEKTLASLLRKIFQIIDNGRTPQGREIRYQALKYLFNEEDQPGLAGEIGVTKAGISKVVLEVAEELGMNHPGLRSDETREAFSEQTKQRHEAAKKRHEEAKAKNRVFDSQFNARKALELNPGILQKL